MTNNILPSAFILLSLFSLIFVYPMIILSFLINKLFKRFKTIKALDKISNFKQAVLIASIFDRASNLQSMENHGFIKGWGSYLSRTNEINAPTLVIHGTEDPIIPYEHGIHLSEVIPNAALVTLEGTGHELHHNDWDEIINVISKHAANL